MEWKNSITDLLGCRYPILQGAYHGLGNWEFAAEVAKAGGYGTITASVSGTAEQLKEDIISCRDATTGAPGSFGVNLTFGFNRDQ
jgi:NAD(P)H-dependent flavin oxidoreductase YrpB (nitropropane dioxygenase family)